MCIYIYIYREREREREGHKIGTGSDGQKPVDSASEPAPSLESSVNQSSPVPALGRIPMEVLS